MLIGRKRELASLQKLYDTNNFECAVIYGRRRIGKTTLINAFSKGKKVIYFTGIESDREENLISLSKSIAAAKGESVEAPAIYASFEAAFSEVARLAKSEKYLFVIDEYPYLAKSYPPISSILQNTIDHEFKPNTNLKMILCGSSMSFMKEQVLGVQSPLFGRRTANMEIKALSYWDAKEFLPSYDPYELFTIYAITGGVPLYLSFMQDDLSVKDNILKQLFDRDGYLFEEPENLLKQELREPGRYNAILTAIAGGSSRLNEIATKVGVPSGSLNYHIESLMDLDIIEKRRPITEKNGKRTIYRIKDGLFRFWFRFVQPYVSFIQQDRSDLVWDIFEKSIPDFLGQSFEDLAIAWLWKVNGTAELPFVFHEAAPWWGTNNKTRQQEEIDILCIDDQKQLLICECKYRNQFSVEELISVLKRRGELFPQFDLRGKFIFSKYPVDVPDGVRNVDLGKMFEEV